MAPFRNPFNKRPPPLNGQVDENTPPNTKGQTKSPEARSTLSSRASSALSIKQINKPPDEFKLSVVNDSGVYLPPSPTEKTSFWSRTPTSTTTSSHRSMLSENEPFSISRESFDSYRRSFDISARSPVVHHDSFIGRQSLDSRSPRTPKSALISKLEQPQPKSVEEEEVFEDIGLNDETKPKKKSFFSRFGDLTESTPEEPSRPGSSHRGFHLPGRKRGQSGQGAELGAIPKPANKEEANGVVR